MLPWSDLERWWYILEVGVGEGRREPHKQRPWGKKLCLVNSARPRREGNKARKCVQVE